MSEIKAKLEADLKTAMLGGDKVLTTTLRGLKSAILYAEVAASKREEGLSDEEIAGLFSKEAKKRQESADLYTQGGNTEKAEAELAEKQVIEGYLPAQMSEEELTSLVDAAVSETGASSMQDMGKVIGQVKAKAGSAADGSRIAALVKERFSQ